MTEEKKTTLNLDGATIGTNEFRLYSDASGLAWKRLYFSFQRDKTNSRRFVKIVLKGRTIFKMRWPFGS